MKALFGPVNGAARNSRSLAVASDASDADRGPHPFGIQGLLRIAELSSKGTDARAFTAAVLDSAVRGLHAEAALIIARGPAAPLLRRHVGSPAMARRLLSHVRGLAWTCADEAVTWTGEARGLAVLGALIPETGCSSWGWSASPRSPRT